MEYIVKSCENLNIDWNDIPTAWIKNSEWTNIPASELPLTYARVVFIPQGHDSGLTVRLYSHEKAPRTYINEIDGKVYTDSCLEFFCNFLPEISSEYVNFEINSNGVLHCAFGSGRHDRKFVRQLVKSKNMPKPITIKSEDCWCIQFTITTDFIKEVYNSEISFKSGSVIFGNFYKSGECCDPIHFLTWSPVETKTPNYHSPEFFGKLIIE